MENRGGDFTAAKRARLRVHSGDSFVFNDERDFHFLTLLSEEIQDDQVNVITEGLQLQKALVSSFMVCDSDDEIDGGGEGEMIREGKLVTESERVVDDDSAGGVEIWLFDSEDTEEEEEENFAGKSAAVGTGVLSDDSGKKSAAEVGLIPDRSAAKAKEKTRSFLKKPVLTTMKIIDSGATAKGENSADNSSPETALIHDLPPDLPDLIPDLPAAEEEENWSFVEISQLASSIVTDSKYSAPSSPETAIIPDQDHSVPAAEDDENWSFIEKSGLKSMKITDSTLNTVKNAAAAPKSWPRKSTPEDDFANWAFMNDSCELCTTEDTLRRLIRIPGCGHYFCHYCFEWYASTELEGSEKCLIKCPAETCFNQIESDHCVALKLQNSLDRRDESISDWEILDDTHNLLP